MKFLIITILVIGVVLTLKKENLMYNYIKQL